MRMEVMTVEVGEIDHCTGTLLMYAFDCGNDMVMIWASATLGTAQTRASSKNLIFIHSPQESASVDQRFNDVAAKWAVPVERRRQIRGGACLSIETRKRLAKLETVYRVPPQGDERRMMLMSNLHPPSDVILRLLSLIAMAQLIVRNIDEKVVKALKQRAAARGHSAEAEHRELLEQALLGPKRPGFKDYLRAMPPVAIRRSKSRTRKVSL